jgi:hypothetical protein
VRFFPRTLLRQGVRRIRLLFRKIVLKNFRKLSRKVFRDHLVVEVFSQEIFQLVCGRADQTPFEAAAPQDLPFQRRYVSYEHLIDNIDRLYRRADTHEKLVIGSGVFALEERRRAK